MNPSHKCFIDLNFTYRNLDSLALSRVIAAAFTEYSAADVGRTALNHLLTQSTDHSHKSPACTKQCPLRSLIRPFHFQV